MRIVSCFVPAGWRNHAVGIAVPVIGPRRLFYLTTILVVGLALVMAGCSRSGKRAKNNQYSKRVVSLGQPVPKGGGRYKVGNPYQINGRWYYPKENTRYDEVGIASWYGEKFHGRYTANGEVFDMNALTAAHPTLPMPTYAQVTNLSNGRSIVVRVNDRGPYAHDREIDLSRKSAQVLGVFRPGTAKVRVRYLGKAPLNGDDSYERRVLASKPWGRQYAGLAPKVYTRAVADTIHATPPPPSSPPVAVARRKADPMTVASVPGQSTRSLRENAAHPVERDAGAKGPLVFVQAGSFRSKASAESVRDSLKSLGKVYVYPAEVRGAMWYRVRLGPYRKPSEARKILDRARQAGARRAAIVRN